VVSVTSEVSANASFQNAAARSARPDSEPPAGNDSFAALVDSNTAASRNDRAQDSAPAPAPRRTDDTATDNRSRDNAAASDKAAADKAARNASNDRDDAAAKARRDDQADSKVDTDTKAATPRRAKSKSDAPKSDKSDETTQASSGDASTDKAGTTQDGMAAVTADAVAVAIPAATTQAATASAASATDKATAPIAIAAAAIAASASLAAETAPATPAAQGTEANATPGANAAQADGAKANAQASVGQAVSAQAAAADPSVATGIAQAASLVAATPATKPAVQLKNPDLARKSATTAVETQNAAGTTATAATAAPAADTIVPAVTPPTEAAGKTKSENGIADAVKADASGNSIAPSAAHANAHFAAPDVSQTLVNSSGNGLQAAGAIQTQQAAAPTTTPAASQLTATAATGAAVPLSGLAMEIAASANSGKTRFEIRLDPAELGRIDVRIDIDRHGQMTSHLTVERPETLSMLRQDANQLQRALDNAGLSTGNSGLQFSLRDQSSQGQNDGNQSNPNAHRLVVSEENSVPAVVAGRSYGRMLGSSGGVDIRV
jgi:flagellar hook-length control protein FliK